MFGVARFNLPAVSNFAPDANFDGDGAESVYFAERPGGFGTLITTNYAYSGAFANGKLVVVGSTQSPGGTSIAATRLEALDGIFKSGLENFYYGRVSVAH